MSEYQQENDLPTVVPAECMVYCRPLFFNSFWTSAISSATETLPVPTYTQGKESESVEAISVKAICAKVLWYIR